MPSLDEGMAAFPVMDELAAHHDSVRAAELTAHLKRGDIAVADRAYTDFGFVNGLDEQGLFNCDV